MKSIPIVLFMALGAPVPATRTGVIAVIASSPGCGGGAVIRADVHYLVTTLSLRSSLSLVTIFVFGVFHLHVIDLLALEEVSEIHLEKVGRSGLPTLEQLVDLGVGALVDVARDAEVWVAINFSNVDLRVEQRKGQEILKTQNWKDRYVALFPSK